MRPALDAGTEDRQTRSVPTREHARRDGVDALGERMEVMLKPLDGLLAGMPGIAGSTLLGDGSVLLVLDLAEVLQ